MLWPIVDDRAGPRKRFPGTVAAMHLRARVRAHSGALFRLFYQVEIRRPLLPVGFSLTRKQDLLRSCDRVSGAGELLINDLARQHWRVCVPTNPRLDREGGRKCCLFAPTGLLGARTP